MIQFFEEDITFQFARPAHIRKWLEHVIRSEGFAPGDINYIFCSDPYLLDMNLRYLDHDTLTDIITFDQSEQDHELAADIFISIDRVRENAIEQNVPENEELERVMVHGLLHLMGYADKTPKQKQLMREKEDACLSLRNQ